MRKTINTLIKLLQELNFVRRFFNGFPELDFNVKGCFVDKEFMELVELIECSTCIFVAPDVEPEIIDLRLLFPG